MRSQPGKSFGVSVLLFLLCAIGGVAVTAFLLISLNPLVSLFPATSGAREIAWGIALMWGLVVAATIGVYAFGSYRRMQQTEGVDYYAARFQDRYVPAAAPRTVQPAYAQPVYAPAPAPVYAPAPAPVYAAPAYAPPVSVVPVYRHPVPQPQPVYQPQPVQPAARPETAAELDQRLRQMEQLMAANRALVERLERAAAPRLVAATQPVAQAQSMGPRPTPRNVVPAPRFVPAPQRLRA